MKITVFPRDVQYHSPVGELLVGGPSRHDGSNETSQESGTVKEHVEGVRYEPEAVGPHPPQQLHKGKGEVQDEEEEKVASCLL